MSGKQDGKDSDEEAVKMADIKENKPRTLTENRNRLLKKRQLERRHYLVQSNVLKKPTTKCEQQVGKTSFNFTPTIDLDDLRNRGILKRRSSLVSAKYRDAKQRALREGVDVIGAIRNLADKVKESESGRYGTWRIMPNLVQGGPTSRPILRSATCRQLKQLEKTDDAEKNQSGDGDDDDDDDDDPYRSSSDSESSEDLTWAGRVGRQGDAEKLDTPLRFRTSLPPLVRKPHEQTFRDVINRKDINGLRQLIRWRRDCRMLTEGELNHALLVAINRREVAIAEVLLMAGAQVEAFGQYNPLILQAAFTNCTEMVRLLVRFGAITNLQHDHQFTPLYFACLRGNYDMARVLVRDGGADVALAAREKLTPLMAAARAGHSKCVSYLLFHSSETVNARDYLGKTSLHYGASSGNVKVVRTLLKHGAEVFVADSLHFTPYAMAMVNGHADVADLLRPSDIQERLLDEETGHQNTMLYYAVRSGHHGTAKDLINRGAEVTNANSGTPYPIIFWAIKNNDLPMIKLLAPLTDCSLPVMEEVKGSTVNHLNGVQYYARDIFSCSNKMVQDKGVEAMEILIKYGADINAMIDCVNVLMHCVKVREWEKVPFLLELGANPNLQDETGSTPLMHACLRNPRNLLTDLIMGNFDMKLASIEGQNGKTPMQTHLQRYDDYTEELVHLVSAGATLNNTVQIIDELVGDDAEEADVDTSGSIVNQTMAETRQKPELPSEKKLLKVLRGRAMNVRPLEEICKLEIKSRLSTGQKRVEADIDQLPLPLALKRYLKPSYKDEYLSTFLTSTDESL